jgi:predicted DNA-binding transcriptional regulator AlpA
MKALRLREVCSLTGLSRSTIWRLERAGTFPARIVLSTNAVGWLAQEVSNWLAARPRAASRIPRIAVRRSFSRPSLKEYRS